VPKRDKGKLGKFCFGCGLSGQEFNYNMSIAGQFGKTAFALHFGKAKVFLKKNIKVFDVIEK